MKYCKDCGCKISDGFCVNCQEEAFIFNTQNEFLPDNLSEDFMNKVVEQEKHKHKKEHIYNDDIKEMDDHEEDRKYGM